MTFVILTFIYIVDRKIGEIKKIAKVVWERIIREKAFSH
jgi:hypothetical protein